VVACHAYVTVIRELGRQSLTYYRGNHHARITDRVITYNHLHLETRT